MGDMACGEFGPGRLPEPEAVWVEIPDALHADLSRRGLPVLIGPATATFVSRLILKEHGERDHEIAALGEPFTPADIAGWARSSLEQAATVVIGTQWRDVVAFVLLVLVLLIKPTGILGESLGKARA